MKLAYLNVQTNNPPRDGAVAEDFRIADVFKRIGTGSGASINGGAIVWTPAGGKSYRILGGIVTSNTAGEVVFTDSVGAFVFSIYVIANTPQYFLVGNNGFLSPTPGNTLKATQSSATLYGTLWGSEE